MLGLLKKSLMTKIGLASATLSLCVALGIGTLSYTITRDQLEKIQMAELQGSARVIATHLDDELSYLYGNLKDMAGNTLFANGLADSRGRQMYLRPFLNSLQKIDNIPVRIILHDFRGRPLESNQGKYLAEIEELRLRQVVESGESECIFTAIGTSDIAITLIYPVMYPNTGLPEGALSLQFSLSTLSMEIFVNGQKNDFRVVVAPEMEGGAEVRVSHGFFPDKDSVFRMAEITTHEIFDPWTMTVEVWEDGRRFARGLKKLINVYLLLGGLGILVIVPASLLLARLLMRRLYSLEAVAKNVVQTRSFDQSFPCEGQDEVASLGQAFNHMLEELKKAYLELRDEAHLEMRLQSERFRQVLSATVDGYIRVDMATLLVAEVNNAFCMMTGIPRNNLEAKPVPLFMQGLLAKAGEADQPLSWTEELDFSVVNGRTRSSLISCSLVHQEDGSSHLIAFLTDVTEHRRAENALRDSERRFRALWEFAPVAVVMVAPDGKIVLINSKAEQTFGYRREELIGQPVEVFIPAGVREVHKRYRRRYLTEEQDSRAMGTGRTFFALHKDGREFPVDVALDYSDAVDGGVAVAYVIDITEQKAVESALSNAKEAAEAANKSKSLFLANMSHELRTPLNAILGYAQILRQGKEVNEQQIKGLDTISSSGRHLLQLINDLLDLSKIESGRMELQMVSFDLPGFLFNIKDMMEVKAKEKQIEFQYEYDTALPDGIVADEKKLRQILLNILGNALKFTDSGRIEFTACSLSDCYGALTNEEYDIIRFKIKDTGPGIPLAQQKDIFLPFQQDQKGIHAAEGTGLGLSISRKLVRMMGGELYVQSSPGKGSVFWFEIEVEKIEALEKVPPPPRFGRVIGYQGQRRTILVVDDNVDNRSVLINMLQPLGFQLQQAENGQECCRKCEEIVPDLILLDLQMPVMDGFETTLRIRGMHISQQPIIIAVTASVFENARLEAFKVGMNDFLDKPIEAESLLDAINTHLQLEWIYETAEESKPAHREEKVAQPMKMLSADSPEVNTLRNLARMGNARKILEELDRIDARDSGYRVLTQKIRQFVKQYQFSKIEDLLSGSTESSPVIHD
jgi:PAS domain S-box-containing protein